MVAIVTGSGAGLGKSSAAVLGQFGLNWLGMAKLPGAAGNAYVNASTGNLIIQRYDELLLGRGPDIGIHQTYNSQGAFDFDNDDNWQVSLYRQLSEADQTRINNDRETLQNVFGENSVASETEIENGKSLLHRYGYRAIIKSKAIWS